ncbi:hypothetical protein QE193_23630 (plasmid) [Arsenophonus nasoniae]|uniref:hypothetical protein n=1 Tax=Arsenophonus nasoniae TaxID=638 RepID=UPI00246883B0|nr:hypothetical protein [Arsenophonus nasoniae]WGM18122.1 hypothetical protein QE193_23630 [Arsenophonus nasoniae]
MPQRLFIRNVFSLPPENDDDRPPEFFYDTLKEAIRHCLRLGPNFFSTRSITRR